MARLGPQADPWAGSGPDEPWRYIPTEAIDTAERDETAKRWAEEQKRRLAQEWADRQREMLNQQIADAQAALYGGPSAVDQIRANLQQGDTEYWDQAQKYQSGEELTPFEAGRQQYEAYNQDVTPEPGIAERMRLTNQELETGVVEQRPYQETPQWAYQASEALKPAIQGVGDMAAGAIETVGMRPQQALFQGISAAQTNQPISEGIRRGLTGEYTDRAEKLMPFEQILEQGGMEAGPLRSGLGLVGDIVADPLALPLGAYVKAPQILARAVKSVGAVDLDRELLQGVGRSPILNEVKRALDAGEIDRDTARMATYLHGVDPDADATTILRISNEARVATAEQAKKGGVQLRPGEQGLIAGETRTPMQTTMYDAKGNPLSRQAAGPTEISLHAGNDQTTITEEWFHRGWDRLDPAQRRELQKVYEASGDTRPINEWFAQRGTEWYFGTKPFAGSLEKAIAKVSTGLKETLGIGPKTAPELKSTFAQVGTRKQSLDYKTSATPVLEKRTTRGGDVYIPRASDPSKPWAIGLYSEPESGPRRLERFGTDLLPLQAAVDREIGYHVIRLGHKSPIKDKEFGVVNMRVHKEIQGLEKLLWLPKYGFDVRNQDVLARVNKLDEYGNEIAGLETRTIKSADPTDVMERLHEMKEEGILQRLLAPEATYESITRDFGQDAGQMWRRYVGKVATLPSPRQMEQYRREPTLAAHELAKKMPWVDEKGKAGETPLWGNGLLADNGKAGLSVDFALVTCQPTSPCKVCYAAANAGRQSVIEKGVRSTMQVLTDPTGFGRRAAMEVLTTSREKFPVVRGLGAGDLTTTEQIEAFNEMLYWLDRPLHIFSRHHDNLRQLRGTGDAPVFAMGSLDNQLYLHYNQTRGREFLYQNGDHNIANAWLFTDEKDADGMADLFDHHALPLVLSAEGMDDKLKPSLREAFIRRGDSPEMAANKAEAIYKQSCPCDAQERTFLASCKTCALRNLGCHMAFADKGVDTATGKLWAFTDPRAQDLDLRPVGQLLETPASRLTAMAGVREAQIDKSIQLVKFNIREFKKGNKNWIGLLDVDFPGQTMYTQDPAEAQRYVDALEGVRAKAKQGIAYLPGGPNVQEPILLGWEKALAGEYPELFDDGGRVIGKPPENYQKLRGGGVAPSKALEMYTEPGGPVGTRAAFPPGAVSENATKAYQKFTTKAERDAFKKDIRTRYSKEIQTDDLPEDVDTSYQVKAGQDYFPGKTQRPQVAEVLKLAPLKNGTRNLDLGGGGHELGTNYLKEKGVTNLVVDKYNRSEEHNARVLAELKQNPPDSVTVANVLNVIEDPAERQEVIRQAYDASADGRPVYFSVYYQKGGQPGLRGTGDNTTWQEMRTLPTYLKEIRQVFPDAKVDKGFIVAHKNVEPPHGTLQKGTGKLPTPDREFGVGKTMTPHVYMHKAYEERLPGVAEVKAKLPKGFDYQIVKYNKKTKEFSFIESPDFDENPYPTVGDSYKIDATGKVKYSAATEPPQIYHDKWLFVDEDYPGFDRQQVMQEEGQFLADYRTTPIADTNRYGKSDFWEAEGEPFRQKYQAAGDAVSYQVKPSGGQLVPAPQQPKPQILDKRGKPIVTAAGVDVDPKAYQERAGYAFNINPEKYPEGIRPIIEDYVAQNEESIAQIRRGVRTDEQVQQDARALVESVGGDFDRLVKRWKPGQAWNAEEVAALRGALRGKAETLMTAQQSYRQTRSTDDLLRLRLALEEHKALQDVLHGVTAEAGRTLRVFRQEVNEALATSDTDRINKLLNYLGGRTESEKIAAMMGNLDVNNPDSVYAFVRAVTKPELGDYLTEIFYNSILSSPKTHVVNSLSNATQMLIDPLVERPLAAGVDAVLAAVQGRQRQRYFGETGAALTGLRLGFADAAKAFGYTVKHGFTPAEAAKLEFRTRAFTGTKGRIINVPSTALAAADQFFGILNQRAALHAQAYRRAKGDPTEYAKLLANPDRKLMQEAEEIADYRLFRQESETVDAIRQGIDRMTTVRIGKNDLTGKPLVSLPIGRFFVPFVRTPWNLLKYGLERSVLGFANPELYINLAKKDPAAADQLARAALGTSLAVGTYLAIGGPENIVGAPPTNAAERDRFYREGKVPYSIKIGDSWYPFSRFEPLNQTLNQLAAYADVQKSDDEIGEAIMSAGATVAKNLTSQTYMSGLSDLIDMVTEWDRYGGRPIERAASAMLTPASSAMRTVAQMADPVVRDPEGIGETIMGSVPGLSGQVPARLTALGEPALRGGGQQTGAGALNPYQPSRDLSQANPVNKEMSRLGYNLTFAGTSISNVKLTRDEQYLYQRLSGQLIEKQLDALIAKQEYRSANDSEKVKQIDKLVADSRAKAREFVSARMKERLASKYGGGQ